MNIDLTPLFTSFTLIFLAELGDKTQICTIILSSRNSPLKVFLGSMLAFFIVDGLSALIGGSFSNFIPHSIIRMIAGLMFIVFGIFSFRDEGCKSDFDYGGRSFMNTFLLISLMELGDKTQLISIFTAATFNNPIMVLCGIMLAFSVVTSIGVIFGSKCLSLIPRKYLRIISAIIFLILGLILIMEDFVL